jgi:excisionase family DNA binding protein
MVIVRGHVDKRTNGKEVNTVKKLDSDRLLSIREAAERLGCGTTTLWSLVREKSLPALRIKGCVRIRPKDIEEFEEKHPY